MTTPAYALVLTHPKPEPRMFMLADREGWEVESMQGFGEDHPRTDVFATRDRLTFVHYVEDQFLRLRYVRIEGEGREAVANTIRGFISHMDRDDLLETIAAGGGDDVEQTLSACAILGGSRPDPRIAAFFRTAFANPEPQVRLTALIAAGYLRWTLFAPMIAELAANDTDEEVQRAANIMLRGTDWSGGAEPQA